MLTQLYFFFTLETVSLGVAGIVWKVKKSRRTDQGSNLPIQNPIYRKLNKRELDYM